MSKRKTQKRNWSQVLYLTIGVIIALSMVVSLIIGSCYPAEPTPTPLPTWTPYVLPTDTPAPSPGAIPMGPALPGATVTPPQ